jgi:thioredoxin-related protein
MMRVLLLSIWVTAVVFAQTFYVLTGVAKFDPLVSSPAELEIYNEDILEEMREMSKELRIDTANHPSQVLAFIITKFSLGETIGFKIELELGEYMTREGAKEAVFALSYLDIRTVENSDNIEDTLMDKVDDMLQRFSHQYKDDNKNVSEKKAGITHENFASQMEYETDYETALAKAKKQEKKLFIFMSTSYCPWCRKIENRVLTKVDINKKIKEKYVPLMLNFSRKNFPIQFREIALTPTLYLVDPKTQKIQHQFVGYSAKDDFLHVLQKEIK